MIEVLPPTWRSNYNNGLPRTEFLHVTDFSGRGHKVLCPDAHELYRLLVFGGPDGDCPLETAEGMLRWRAVAYAEKPEGFDD